MKNAVRILGLMFAVMLVAGLIVNAQDAAKVAGKWDLSYVRPMPPGKEGEPQTVTNTLTLEQTGGDIKGTLASQRGETPVTGKVTGKDIKFSVTRETPQGSFTTEYTGKVDGDTMKGTFTMGQGERARTIEWTAKKAK